MFNIGLVELFIIMVIATIFVGPERIPEVARQLGKFSRKVKGFMRELTESDPLKDDDVAGK